MRRGRCASLMHSAVSHARGATKQTSYVFVSWPLGHKGEWAGARHSFVRSLNAAFQSMLLGNK